MTNLAENLTRLKGLHKVRLADTHDWIGIAPQNFSELCNGTRNPSLGTMMKLSNFFGIPIDGLLYESVEDLISDRERYLETEARKVS